MFSAFVQQSKSKCPEGEVWSLVLCSERASWLPSTFHNSVSGRLFPYPNPQCTILNKKTSSVPDATASWNFLGNVKKKNTFSHQWSSTQSRALLVDGGVLCARLLKSTSTKKENAQVTQMGRCRKCKSGTSTHWGHMAEWVEQGSLRSYGRRTLNLVEGIELRQWNLPENLIDVLKFPLESVEPVTPSHVNKPSRWLDN